MKRINHPDDGRPGYLVTPEELIVLLATAADEIEDYYSEPMPPILVPLGQESIWFETDDDFLHFTCQRLLATQQEAATRTWSPAAYANEILAQLRAEDAKHQPKKETR